MKVSPIDLNLLAVLDAILQTESVGRAAEQVGITKPAMSHALSRLREQMGDPVLVRSGQDWHLSERALAMRDRVREVAEGARLALTKEQSFDPLRSTKEFRVHATDHMLALLGTGLGAALAKEAPSCALRFLPIQVDDASPLRNGDVDLALGVFSDLPPEFLTQALFRETFAWVVRKGHPRVRGKVNLKCYLAMNHVLVAPRGRSGSTVDAALAERGLSRKVTRFVPYFVVALDLVSRTDCAVTISERLANAYADRFGLQVLKPPIALPPYSIQQLWHPRLDADPSHRWFRKLVAQVAGEVSGKAASPRSAAGR
jgi:DNA-binding transcriptional LysR family regulator